MRNHHRRHRGGGAMRALCASRHEKGVTYRTSRGSRHYATARGVHHADAPVRPPRLAGERPHRGRSRRGRVVPADLSHRAEDSARMVEMKWSGVSGRLSALLVLLTGPVSSQTSLSIYTDGRVVVRRTLAQALEKGRNALTLQLEDLDPATLFSPDTSAAVVSAVVRAPTDREAALRHAVGQTLAFVAERSDGRRGTVRASVVRVTPPQYRLSDGRFLLSEPGEPLFPSGLVRAAPEVSLLLEATRPRPRTELAWVAQGASWEASYQVVLAGAKCEVSGTATILAQSLRADSADVQLVAGSIARARPEPKLMDYVSGVARVQMQAAEIASPPAEQAVGETHVYPLSGRLSVEPGSPVTSALFPRASVPYTQELMVPGAPPCRGLPPRQRVTAVYRVTITNAKPEALTVDVREARYGVWQILESSVSAEKLSATEVRFRVPVAAGGTATLTYTVQAES